MTYAYFSLPRSLKAAAFFERHLPALALRLPAITLPDRVVHHVLGAGVWSVALVNGQLDVQPGVVGPIGLQISMTEAHFREAMTGALRDRHLEVLKRQRLPLEIPDLTRLQVDPARLRAAIAVGGSVAIVIHDREYDDRYRYVLTIGAGPAAYDKATTTIEVDADDLVALVAARTPPMAVLVSGKLRLAGDIGLPGKLLSSLFGRS